MNIHINPSILVREKVISQKVADDILEWYNTHKQEKKSRKFLQIFTTIGAIVTGIGILLLIAANWGVLSPLTKTGILLCTTLIIYAIGYFFAYIKQDFQKTGEALILLGSISYGASIFLLGQIYNIGGNFSGAMLLWSIGVIPLAYFSRLSSIFILSIILIQIYAISSIWDYYREVSGFIVALIFMVLGYIHLSLIQYHEKFNFSSFAKILGYFGVAGILGSALPFTFNAFWIFESSFNFSSRGIINIILIGTLIGLGLTIFEIIKRKKFDYNKDAPFFFGAIPIVLLSLYTVGASRGNYDSSQYNLTLIPGLEGVYVVAMNVIYLGLIAYMIFTGIKKEKASYINLAIAFFGIYLLSKYIAFIDYNKMDGAFIFITGGIACMLIGWLSESMRRKFLKKINS